MNLTTTIFFVFSIIYSGVSFSQFSDSAKLVDFGTTNISIGSVQGIHPNLRNSGFGNFIYGDLNQEVHIKGIPFKINGRLSNEVYRIGRPSFFQLRYDNVSSEKMSSQITKAYRLGKEEEFHTNQAELFKLEGQLSYKKEMLRRMAIPSGNLDSLNYSKYQMMDSLDIPLVKIDNVKIDSLNADILASTERLKLVKNKVDSLKLGLDELPLVDIGVDRLKIKHFDLGLTSLSHSSLSNNAIPIHGIRVEGTYRKSFYDVSAGLTQPFVNFNTQIFSQLTASTQNVFNLDNFYKTPKMRLVTSTVAGLGTKYKDNVRLEHFYMGKSLEAIRKKQLEQVSNTINAAGNYTRLKNLELGCLLGISFIGNDTLNSRVDLDNLSYKGTFLYKLPSIRSLWEMEYRSIGKKYDSNSQGLLINGTTHRMIGFSKNIFNFSKVSIRYIEDTFSKTDSIVLFDNSKKILGQLNFRLNSTNNLSIIYNYIKGSGEEVGVRAGELGTLMYVNEISIGKNKLVTTVQGGYIRMPSRIGYQEITNGSFTTQLHLQEAFLGIKGNYEKYNGLQQFWGENYIVEPSLGFKKSNGALLFSYQYSWSNQFGKDNGINLRAHFSPSQFLTWQITAQKWLLKERNLFFYQAPSYVAPWYIDVKMIVHLNVMK